MRKSLRAIAMTALVPTLSLGAAAAVPGCSVGYLAQQGWFQAELLAGREPIEEVIASGALSEPRIERLRLVPRIKAFGAGIGLASTDNYDTINPDWKRTIRNVSASDPVAFRPVRWWFPIVGRVPYLGYFREPDARRRARELEQQGYDVYVRTAGAYSTLGWFRDPVLPSMLDGTEFALAETILHELAHATLWVKGSVQFNESFANFVGETAAIRYLEVTYGVGSEPVLDAKRRLDDRLRFRAMLHGLYEDLEAVYDDPTTSRAEKLVRKHRLFATLPTRTAAIGLHREEAYLRQVRAERWNNARLVQFRTYNRSREWFDALLVQEDGDLLAFIERIDELTRDADDPYAALALAVGAEPPPPDDE